MGKEIREKEKMGGSKEGKRGEKEKEGKESTTTWEALAEGEGGEQWKRERRTKDISSLMLEL